jgi:hypothetical protein
VRHLYAAIGNAGTRQAREVLSALQEGPAEARVNSDRCRSLPADLSPFDSGCRLHFPISGFEQIPILGHTKQCHLRSP